ncbi:MAG TPA: DinB family protein [Gemmatimonadaceae bacterium]
MIDPLMTEKGPMTEQWFKRKFAFDLPASRYPNVLERLRGTPARVEERTRSLLHELLVRRLDDRWSIQENVGHLVDLEPLWLRRVKQFVAGAVELEPTDLANRATHEANHNSRPLSELLAEFRERRRQLIDVMSAVDDAVIERSALHPRLRTPMRLIDHAFFVAEHDDHHLATIASLLTR